MATRNQELMNPASCLNKAQPAEPVFVLRSKDPLGSYTVRAWAQAAEAGGVHEPEKIADARRQADAMDAYRLAHFPGTLAPPEQARD